MLISRRRSHDAGRWNPPLQENMSNAVALPDNAARLQKQPIRIYGGQWGTWVKDMDIRLQGIMTVAL